jgi:hypothetical protein|tara:strand:- start:1423 stop:1635 length:213 start_codon:yes stop_codon:yes gene_type:complete
MGMGSRAKSFGSSATIGAKADAGPPTWALITLGVALLAVGAALVAARRPPKPYGDSADIQFANPTSISVK